MTSKRKPSRTGKRSRAKEHVAPFELKEFPLRPITEGAAAGLFLKCL